MSLTIPLALLRAPDLRARLWLRRELRSYLRLQFLAAATEMQLLDILRTPTAIEDLNDRLRPARADTLLTFLDLGVALGELRRAGATYRLRGSMARALAASTGAPLRAAVLELVDYHAAAYRDLGDHLASGAQRDYLAGRAGLIAQSSRLVEPALAAFVRELVEGHQRIRILELGCGSGIYLGHAAAANQGSEGIGVEINSDVAQDAQALLGQMGLLERFSVVRADARCLPSDIGGGFDLITLYNNIYYFPVSERVALFAALRARLVSGGRLVVATMMRGTTPASLNLSLVLAETEGCTALPRTSSRSACTRAVSRASDAAVCFPVSRSQR